MKVYKSQIRQILSSGHVSGDSASEWPLSALPYRETSGFCFFFNFDFDASHLFSQPPSNFLKSSPVNPPKIQKKSQCDTTTENREEKP